MPKYPGIYLVRAIWRKNIGIFQQPVNIIHSMMKLDLSNKRTILDFLSGIVDMAATISSFSKNLQRAKYGTIDSIKTRLANPENYKYVKTYNVSSYTLRHSVNIHRIAILSNVISGGFGMCLSLLDAFNRAMLGDTDAAVAYGIMSAGFLVTVFATSVMLGVVGFAIIALGFILVWLFTDTELETLLKNCQFGKSISSRFGGNSGYIETIGLGSGKFYGSWDRNREYAYHEVSSYFYSPRVFIEESSLSRGERLVVDITTPLMTSTGRKNTRVYVKGYGAEWQELGVSLNAIENIGGDHALITSIGPKHTLEISKAILQSAGTRPTGGQYSITTETSLKVEVQYFPFGEGRSLFEGTDVIHYYPAPTRDSIGRPTVEGEVVSESRAKDSSCASYSKTIKFSIY